MSRTRLRHAIVAALLFLAPAVFAEETPQMDPAPADWPNYQYKREPGQFKRSKAGLIDPTPDVVSLKFLPKDNYGFVDWAKAIKDGIISPVESLPGISKPIKDEDRLENTQDILIKSKMDFMPDVLFPHTAHTVWLKCSVCHPKIFKKKAGENNISMVAIWKGNFCGRCHDRVAFPIRNCFKCHSVPKHVKK